AHDLVRGKRARTKTALVTATMHLRFDAHTRLASYVQCADALGAICLVCREGHQVDLLRSQVDGDLASGLRGIDVKDDALFAADLADLIHVLYHTDFVVHGHDRYHGGVRPQCSLEDVDIDEPVFLHIEVGDFKALTLEFATGI